MRQRCLPAYLCGGPASIDGRLNVAKPAAGLGVAQHRRIDEARRHRVDSDACGSVLQRQRLGQSVQADLAAT